LTGIAFPHALIVGGLAGTALISRNSRFWIPTAVVSLPIGLVAFRSLDGVDGLAAEILRSAGVNDLARGIAPHWSRTGFSAVAALIFVAAALAN
jgi:hypothetical protein